MILTAAKINDEIVRPIPQDPAEVNNKPVLGAAILSEIYCNVFALAKKNSGKTTVFYKIIKDTCDKRCKIYAFVATLNKDDKWAKIKKLCQNKNIEFNGFTSIMDDEGNDIIDNLVQELQEQYPENEKDEETQMEKKRSVILCDSDTDTDEEDEKKKKRYKTRVPEYVFILDDLSEELKGKAITALLKKNRHFKSRILIGNQYYNDVSKSGRKNLDYMMIFRLQPIDKLQEIHRELDLSTPFDVFYQIYKFAIQKPYDFLYIDIVREQFRRNFNINLTVSERELDDIII